MAGGNWTTQNKVRPGVYVNTRSNSLNVNMNAERGVVTLPLESDWGANEVVEVTATSNFVNLFGHDLGSPQLLTIREALKRASRLLVYRVNGGTVAFATTSNSLSITARHAGARGNNLSIRMLANVDTPDTFSVQTLLDTTVVDVQQASTIQELQTNDFVRFDGVGALWESAGITLTGGTTELGTGGDYIAYFGALESYEFNTMALPVADNSTIKQTAVNYITRLRNDEGRKCQLAVADMEADNYAVINVRNGVVLQDGTVVKPHLATAWVAGATAGANVNESNTYTVYEGATGITERLSNSEIITALRSGEFLFTENNGRVVVEQDINSQVNFTVYRDRSFSKNRVIRVLDDIANGIRQMVAQNFIGQVANNENGRDALRAAIIERLNELQNIEAIENFDVEDVFVLPGRDKDAVLVQLSIQPVDAMEKIYVEVEVV